MINFSDIGLLQPTAADIKRWDDFHQFNEDRQSALIRELSIGESTLADAGQAMAQYLTYEVWQQAKLRQYGWLT